MFHSFSIFYFSYNSSLKLMFIVVLADPSTQTLHPFHEDINSNGSMTLLVKAEHGHPTPTKFLWHGI
jgi:hypothetical protein